MKTLLCFPTPGGCLQHSGLAWQAWSLGSWARHLNCAANGFLLCSVRTYTPCSLPFFLNQTFKIWDEDSHAAVRIFTDSVYLLPIPTLQHNQHIAAVESQNADRTPLHKDLLFCLPPPHYLLKLPFFRILAFRACHMNYNLSSFVCFVGLLVGLVLLSLIPLIFIWVTVCFRSWFYYVVFYCMHMLQLNHSPIEAIRISFKYCCYEESYYTDRHGSVLLRALSTSLRAQNIFFSHAREKGEVKGQSLGGF